MTLAKQGLGWNIRYKMIISISGVPGSGKTTVAKILAKKLGMNYYYMGGIRRDMARKNGLTLAQFNKLGEKDPSTDLEVDKYQKELGEKEDNFVIQGRTSFHFIPHSIKIFLNVNLREGARRIFQDIQENPGERNEPYKSLEETSKEMKKRIISDKIRYKKYYNFDSYDKKHYDLVIDTTHLPAEKVAHKIMDFVKKK